MRRMLFITAISVGGFVAYIPNAVATSEVPGCVSGDLARRADVGERFGIRLNLSESEVARLMRKQGFSIGRGKGSVAIAKDSQNVLDKFYIVDEDAGSLKRWNSAYVALGFKKGELAVIFDTAGFDISKDEAEAVFRDMDSFFRWKYSSEPTPSALPATLRASFLGPIQIFRSAHWGTDAQAVDMFIIEAIGKPEMRRLAVVYYAPPAFTGLQAR